MENGRHANHPLAHRRVMVLEDDFAIKNGLEALLERAGATISSVYHPRLDAAILDVCMNRGLSSTQVARELSRRGVPFFFYTGQSEALLAPVRSEWPNHVIMSKPQTPDAIVKTILALLAEKPRPMPGQMGRTRGLQLRSSGQT